jgi:hypothetical protein
MTEASHDPVQALASLRSGVAQLADDLYRLETDPELQLLKDPSKLQGSSAAVVRDLPAVVQSVWERYPLLKEAVDQIDAALAQGGPGGVATAQTLLAPGAITLADGTKVAPLELLGQLRADVDRVVAAGEKLAAAWRDVIPRLDAASASLRAAEQNAQDIGLGQEPSLRAARQLVDRLSDMASTDPLAVGPEAAEQAVERVRSRIDGLAERRISLPSKLVEAHALLDELDRLVPAGRDALAATQAKVAHPSGLLTPLDLEAADRGERGLRRWLARLEQAAADGEWLAAAEGLDSWRHVADGWIGNAQAVLAANRAPLDRRNELRGLLDAYRAKAGAMGRVEDSTVAGLYKEAHDVLYVAPCDVDRAAELVARYRDAVNGS